MKLLILFLFMTFRAESVLKTEEDKNLVMARKLMALDASLPNTNANLENMRKLIMLMQDPSKRNQIVNIIKSIKSGNTTKQQAQRKLGPLGINFLDDTLPILKNEYVSTALSGGILAGGVYAANTAMQSMEVSKLKKSLLAKKSDLTMIKAQKDRDQRYIDQSIVDLEDRLADLEETMNSNLEDLDHWVEGTVNALI
jgi:hypothetical protein